MIYDDATIAHKFLCEMALDKPDYETPITRELIDEHMQIAWDVEPNTWQITTSQIPQFRPLDSTLSYLLAELAWYSTGSNCLADIASHSNFWTKISDDGVTVNSAYGNIIQYRDGFNQMDQVLELLGNDKYSRRAVIYFGLPNIARTTTKDEICTTSVQFLWRGDTIHCIAAMRSQDLWFGFQYDVPFFASLASYVAYKLYVKHCILDLHVGSMHLYLRNVDEVSSLLCAKPRLEPKNISISMCEICDNAYDILKYNKSSLMHECENIVWRYEKDK